MRNLVSQQHSETFSQWKTVVFAKQLALQHSEYTVAKNFLALERKMLKLVNEEILLDTSDLFRPDNDQKPKKKTEIPSAKRTVTLTDMVPIVSEETGKSYADICSSIGSKATDISKLTKAFKQRIIGQNRAAKALLGAMKRTSLGLNSGGRPTATFLLAGPTGVGKTEIVKVLAAECFGSSSDILRLDMSEYGGAESSSRLIGAAPGLIGYDAGGQLTGPIKKRPNTLILLDEIEKAHPKIFDLFLQVFDDGILTDSSGFTVDFSKTLIVATSNLGATEILDYFKKLPQPSFNLFGNDNCRKENEKEKEG